jgi:hypothetical protein
VLGDLLDIEHLSELLHGGPGLGVLEQQFAQRVSDLLTAAVAHCHIHRQPGPVPGSGCRGGQPLRHLRR